MSIQPLTRITDAGVDVQRLMQTTVLIKLGFVSPDRVFHHPVYALVRALSALGFESIFLCGSTEYLDILDEAARQGRFEQFPGAWITQQFALMAPAADIIIDLSNDYISQFFSRSFGEAHSCPCLSVMWGSSWAAVSSSAISITDLSQLTAANPLGEQVPDPVARIASGLALQEVIMLAADVHLAAPLEKTIIYNASSTSRTSKESDQSWEPRPIENTVIDVVGTGAVGSNLLECIAPMFGQGCDFRIFDFDVVSPENLAVQPAFTVEDIGSSKALVMAEKLKRFNPALPVRPFVIPYEQKPESLTKPQLRIICVDNWKTRKWVNDLSTRYDYVPIADTGSSPLAAEQRNYIPGRSPCLSCRIPDLEAMAAKEQKSESCSTSSAPTLPGTNMIISGVLATEALKHLKPESFGVPSRDTIVFDTRFPSRFAVLAGHNRCQH